MKLKERKPMVEKKNLQNPDENMQERRKIFGEDKIKKSVEEGKRGRSYNKIEL